MQLIAILIPVFFAFAEAQDVSFTSMPSKYQFFARDNNDSAVVPVTGSVSSGGFDSVSVEVYKDGILWKRSNKLLSYIDDCAPFSFLLSLHAELCEYRVVVKFDTSTIRTADSLVCGDAYLVEGQSNAVALASDVYQSEWIRSFGSSTTNGDTCLADSAWGIAQSLTTNSHCAIGVWEMEIAKSIVATYKIPVFVLNGAVGGTRIEHHYRSTKNKSDLTTIYGRFYHRIMKTGLANSVRALFWYQGEYHLEVSAPNYASDWGKLRSSWKEDFPGITTFYVMQIRSGCRASAGPRQDIVMEQQRRLPDLHPDVKIMSTIGLKGHDGCHFDAYGYRELGENLFRLVARDYYRSADTVNIASPNIRKVFYADDALNRIVVNFDQPIDWPSGISEDSFRNYFYLDSVFPGIVDSGRSVGNSIVLYLNAPLAAQHLTYFPDASYTGSVIRNLRGVGALSFMDYPVGSGDPNDTLTISSIRAMAFPEVIEQYGAGRLSVEVTYSNGLADTTVNGCLFTTLDPFVATVDILGNITGHNRGVARIGVEKRGMVDTLNIPVNPTTALLDSICMSRDGCMLVAGDSLDVNVMAAYRTSAGRAFRAVIDSYAVWSSAVSNVAVINGGRLHAVSEGKTQIMAFFDGMADTMEVTVLQKPVFVKRINFQATSTPFRDGWLADNGALYSAVKGYGWSGSGTLIKADTRKGDNFLFKSLVITSAPRVYILDVPDGEYQIRIGMGDNVYGINNAAWTLIGSDTICMKLPFHENVVATTSAVAVAGGTGLRLTVNGAINYIVVCSSSEGVPIDLVADDGYYSGSTNVLNRNTDREIVSLDAFPNPFNPSTLIRFSLPGGESHDVRILLFSVSGRLIRELIPVKNRKHAQQLLWDGRDNHGRTVASGQYVAVLTNSKYHVRKRLLLIR